MPSVLDTDDLGSSFDNHYFSSSLVVSFVMGGYLLYRQVRIRAESAKKFFTLRWYQSKLTQTSIVSFHNYLVVVIPGALSISGRSRIVSPLCKNAIYVLLLKNILVRQKIKTRQETL